MVREMICCRYLCLHRGPGRNFWRRMPFSFVHGPDSLLGGYTYGYPYISIKETQNRQISSKKTALIIEIYDGGKWSNILPKQVVKAYSDLKINCAAAYIVVSRFRHFWQYLLLEGYTLWISIYNQWAQYKSIISHVENMVSTEKNLRV